jgi:hypothetical protein
MGVAQMGVVSATPKLALSHPYFGLGESPLILFYFIFIFKLVVM